MKHFTFLTRVIPLYFLFQSPLFAEKLTLSCPQKEISIDIEIAKTPKEKAKGLMFRTSLPPEGGMLFLYDPPQPVAMWMKNTVLSLDMIFADRNGNILAIFENTTPYSLTPQGPIMGTAQVLEILGGTIKAQEITKDCTLSL